MTAVRKQLERHRRRECLYELVGGNDHDEALGREGDDLLASVGAAPSFDEPSRRVDLVRAVDRHVEAVEPVERLDQKAELPGLLFGGRRGGDAAEVEPAFGEGGQEIGDGGASPEPDRGSFLDKRGGGLGGGPLLTLGIGQFCHSPPSH